MRDLQNRLRTTQPVPAVAEGVSSHLFEDRLLVFSERHQKLYALNNTAALVWLCFEQGMTVADVVATLVSTYGINSEQAQADMTVALSEWEAAGLVRIGEANRLDLTHKSTQSNGRYDKTCSHPLQHPDLTDAFRLSLLGSEFVIRCASPEMSAHLDEVFGHLASVSTGPARLVDIVESDDGFLIQAPGVPVVESIEPEHLMSTLTQTILRSAYRNCDFLIAVHAAVVGLGNHCMILSGQSGNGKSTLAAALMKGGFTYFTDEVALVDRVTRHVVPAPVSLRIKESGSDLVTTMFPHVHTLPWHVLADGKRVRYLQPPAGSFARGSVESCAARWLVFPRYSPQEQTGIAPMNRVDAIARLQSTGYDIGGVLDRTKITEILSWLKTVDCYEMNVSQLDRAVHLLRSLMR